MHPLMEYRNDREMESKNFKQAVLELHEENELSKNQLEKAMDEMFRYGHYCGHCQGEHYVKSLYGKLENE